MKQDEAANPVDVGLLSTETIMLETNLVANLVKQLRRL